MTITLNGTTGISNDGGYTGDGVSFADTTPANTLVTTTGGNVGIGTSSPAVKLQVSSSTAADGAIARLELTNISVFGGDKYGQLQFYGNDSSSSASGVRAYVVGEAGGANGEAALVFGTANTNAAVAERARIDSSGNLLVGTTSLASKLSVSSTTEIGRFQNTSGTGNIRFVNSSDTTIGYIQWSGSSTSYVTSSDYRLKENIAPMIGALATVAQLKPVTYTWKADGSDGQGFIAHELQAVVPDCVTGEKDAVDADGNPQYQGIDTSFLVATLTAAIQELKAELDTVKAEVTALKGTA